MNKAEKLGTVEAASSNIMSKLRGAEINGFATLSPKEKKETLETDQRYMTCKKRI